MGEILKLFIGLGCITILGAALGFINLEEYGLGGLQESIAPVVSDIKTAMDYFQHDFLRDMEDKLNQWQQR